MYWRLNFSTGLLKMFTAVADSSWLAGYTCRALKSHALGVRITHLSHFSPSHAFLLLPYVLNGVAKGSMGK